MAKRNGDDEAQVDHLSKRPRVHGKDRQAKAFSHWTTSTHAFPSSAAAFHNGLRWIGTPWIQGPEITALTLRKISDRAHGHLGFERPAIPVMMQLGSPAFISDFTVYAVFPNLQKSIAVTPDCKYLEKWTDKIMLPTMYKFLNGSRLQYLTPSHRMIVLNSRAERIEAMRDVGDNPYKYYLLGDVFRQVWDEVVTTTQQAQFAEFRDVFLVAVGDLHPTSTASVDFEQALEKTFQIWEDFMDMQEVAKGDLEIRIETQMII